MPESSREKPKPPSLDWDSIPRQRVREALAKPERVTELLPQGSRTPYRIVFPQIGGLLEDNGLNTHSKSERDAGLGILVGLVPEGEGARELRDAISKWNPPQ